MRSLKSVAEVLAAAHRKADAGTTTVKFFPAEGQNEVRLLEVSSATPTLGEILPYGFKADKAHGVDYPSVVILVSPSEWRDIQDGKLRLPKDWQLEEAVDI